MTVVIKVFAFDFDGVLAKNVGEIATIALAAWKKMNGRTKIKRKQIRKARDYFKDSHDVYAALFLLENRRKINKEAIKNFLKNNRKDAEAYSKLFYSTRHEVMDRNLKNWLSLFTPVDFAVRTLNELLKNQKVYIISARDNRSTATLLKHFGVRINRNNILTREISLDKWFMVKTIIEREKVRKNEVLFIDDLVDHLRPLHKKGVRTALASWGYTTPKKIKEAKSLGIPAIDENNLPNYTTERFDVVDKNDRVIGSATRAECHKYGLLHRGIFVLVVNNKGKILLQKRSMAKDTSPGLWTTSVSGHVDSGETYESAAKREMKEEIGVAAKISSMFSISFREKTKQYDDREIEKVFFTKHDGPFRMNREEADKVEFFDIENIERMRKSGLLTPATVAIFNYLEKRPELLKRLGLS